MTDAAQTVAPAESGLDDPEVEASAADRVVVFSDAVVAIAITLLVLPLVDLTRDLTENESVADLLRAHQPELWSFLLSFVVIARLWFAQHQIVRPLVASHEYVSALLVFWMLTIAFGLWWRGQRQRLRGL